MYLHYNFRRRLQSPGAWTLLEMMIASACGVIVLTGLIITVTFVSKSFTAIGNYVDMNAASRHTLDVMSRDIRGAAAYSLTAYATNKIVLTNADGSSFAYVWDPNTTALTRYYTNAAGSVTTTTMLTNCDLLTFNIYQRNPTNDLQFVSTTSYPSLTKLIDVSWRCSRTIYGAKLNTESIQTARIVIRN